MLRIVIALAAGGLLMSLLAGCTGGADGAPVTTRRVWGTALVFDVPADAPLRVVRMDADDFVSTHISTPPPSPSPFRRHDFGKLPSVYFRFVHVPTYSELVVVRRTEFDRIIYRPTRPNEAYMVFPRHSRARYLVDLPPHWVVRLSRIRLIDRYPLDRVSILPDVAVQFVRTPIDALFDQVLDTLRPGGQDGQ